MAALEQTLARVRKGDDMLAAREQAEDGDELEQLSREELYERAQREKIPGRSKMDREELAAALRDGDES